MGSAHKIVSSGMENIEIMVLWLIYGIYHESVPMILANFITAVLLFVMIVLKLKYK